LPDTGFVASGFHEEQTNSYVGGFVAADESSTTGILGLHQDLVLPAPELDGNLFGGIDTFGLLPEFTDPLEAANSINFVQPPDQPANPLGLALDLGLSNALENPPLLSFPFHAHTSTFVDYTEEIRDFENGSGITTQFSRLSSPSDLIGSAPIPSLFNQVPSISCQQASSGIAPRFESGSSTEFSAISQSQANNSDSQVNEPRQRLLLQPADSFPCSRCRWVFSTEQSLMSHCNTKHKAYVCNEDGCPRNRKSFITKRDLERHRTSVHGSRILLPCGKTRSNRLDNNLWRHATPNVCPTCSSQIAEIIQAAGVKEHDETTPRRGRKRKTR